MTSFSTPEPTASKRASKMGPLATKGNKKRHKLGDKQGSKGDKALGRRTHHPTKGDKKGGKLGDKGEGGHTIQQRETRRETSWETSWKTRETRPWEGGHTIQQRETRRDTRGDKTFGRRRHHPTQAHLGKANTASNTGTHVGDNGRQGEAMRAIGGIGRQELAKTRTCEGRHTLQHRHTYAGRLWETMGDKGRQDLG